MDFNDYQRIARTTAIYPAKGTKSNEAVNYNVLGINGETGEFFKLIVGFAGESNELSNIWKKALRDGDFTIVREKLRYELGDILWYLSQLADELGMTLEQVAISNVEKLRDRKVRNQLAGSGDNR